MWHLWIFLASWKLRMTIKTYGRMGLRASFLEQSNSLCLLWLGAESEAQWVLFMHLGSPWDVFASSKKAKGLWLPPSILTCYVYPFNKALAPGPMWRQRMWNWFSGLLIVSPSWSSFLRLHNPVPPYYWTTPPFPPYPASSTEGPLFLWCLFGLWWSLFSPL